MRTSPSLRSCFVPADDLLHREVASILHTSGPALIDTLHRLGGSDGLALGYAFRDIARDPQMPPDTWPVADVLAMLATAEP